LSRFKRNYRNGSTIPGKAVETVVNVKGRGATRLVKSNTRKLVRTSPTLLLEPKDQGVVAIATHLQRQKPVIDPTALASTRRSIRIAIRSPPQSGLPARLRVFSAKTTGSSLQLDGSASGSGVSELQSTGGIKPHATRNIIGAFPSSRVVSLLSEVSSSRFPL
jgi:hypothetical protein